MWEESELFVGTPFYGTPVGLLIVLGAIVLFWTIVAFFAIRLINVYYHEKKRGYRNPRTGKLYGVEWDERAYAKRERRRSRKLRRESNKRIREGVRKRLEEIF